MWGNSCNFHNNVPFLCIGWILLKTVGRKDNKRGTHSSEVCVTWQETQILKYIISKFNVNKKDEGKPVLGAPTL